MIEQLLGTALLCCIITAFFYCLFYKIACKSNINDFEADSPYIGDYASSIIVFLAISSLTLLIVVYFYITISPKLPKFLNDSVIIPGLFEPPVRTLRATIPENESHIFR